MYPSVFKDYAQFRDEYGPVTGLPTRLFFVGPELGEEIEVEIEKGKNLHLKILAVGDVNETGHREVFCEANGQLRSFLVEDKKVSKVRHLIDLCIRFRIRFECFSTLLRMQ